MQSTFRWCSPTQLVASYFTFQAVATALWWAMIASVPATTAWFQPSGDPAESLHDFWLADGVLVLGGSLLASVAVLTRQRWATVVVWSLAAVVTYPTLHCLSVSMRSGEGWLASAMMAGMSGVCWAIASAHSDVVRDSSPETAVFIRPAKMSTGAAIGWTVAQTVLFWGVFLWVFPQAIVELERRFGVTGFRHGGQDVIAAVLFLAASSLGLWSGVTMALAGKGTPLPTATAPEMVISGPYRYVRNPMALAGIGQGVAVGWWMGSVTVIAYAAAGSVVWHVLVRPIEEADLQRRFGNDYREYRRRVWLWCPTLPSATASRTMYGQKDHDEV